jgi:hypothetical protein
VSSSEIHSRSHHSLPDQPQTSYSKPEIKFLHTALRLKWKMRTLGPLQIPELLNKHGLRPSMFARSNSDLKVNFLNGLTARPKLGTGCLLHITIGSVRRIA